jgi:hypothetical protein
MSCAAWPSIRWAILPIARRCNARWVALHAGQRPSTVAIQIARPDGGSLAAMARFTAVRDFTGVLRAATITLLELDEGELPTLHRTATPARSDRDRT